MQKLKRKLYKYLPLLKIVLWLFAICYLLFAIFRLLPAGFRFIQSLVKISRQSQLQSHRGRVNILFLGAGGANHAAADLTDSLILTSTKIENGETVILSLPRDIWVDSMRAKINTAYHYGEEKKPGGGLVLAKAVVAEILGLPVHYAILINFDGFLQAVDLVGGVDIKVERSFDDYKYPIPGMETAEPEELRYEHLRFEAGWQHMDGQQALKYIRSRYAEGEEGTDFARSKRQQRFLLAFKDKIFSMKTLFNLKKVKELMKIFADSVKTDIQEKEYAALIKLALKVKEGKMETTVLDEGLLYNPPRYQYDGHWVLVPKAGDWHQVQNYLKELLF